jgi:hypothetical protein
VPASEKRRLYSAYGSAPISPDEKNPSPSYVPPSIFRTPPSPPGPSSASSGSGGEPPAGSFIRSFSEIFPSLANFMIGKYRGTSKLIE